MDQQQAKFVLQSYQRDSDSPLEPQFREALARLESDPELKAWMAGEEAQDLLVRQKLAEVPVPVSLRARILSEAEVPSTAKIISWRPLLALAAAIVFLLGFVWWKPFSSSQPQFAAYRVQMVETLYRPLNFEFQSADPEALQAWVTSHSPLGSVHLPDPLARLPGRGCRTLEFQGHAAVVICFLTSAESAVHLFVLSGRGIEHQLNAQAQLAAVGAFQTASWVEGELIYLLAGGGDSEVLKRFLPGNPAVTVAWGR